MILICPKCKCELVKTEKILRCTNNHSYDISKEGYTNLLLANQKKSLLPGDNKIMAQAREGFLNNNYYDKLLDFLTKLIKNISFDNTNILDAGCGTGFYINNIEKNVKHNEIVAVDISKDALKIASKHNKNVNFVVASLFSMPIKDGSVDIILNCFAPKPTKEFDRVLKENGVIVEVTPGENHLIELKNLLYDKVYLNPKGKFLEGFKLTDNYCVTYKENMTCDIVNLFYMTPYFYTTSQEKIQTLKEIESIDITFDFNINVYTKILNQI